MNRENLVNGIAEDILKTAQEEILSSPLAKTASENDVVGAMAEKIAGVFSEAAGIYKAAEETMEAADNQEELARQALEENGIDPDEVIAAAEEAAREEIENQTGEEESEEQEEE